MDGNWSYIEHLDAAVEKAMMKAGALIEASAKSKCPTNNGELINSIVYDTKKTLTGWETTVGTNKSYAPYVEFGTGLFASNGDGRKDVPWCYQDDNGEWHSTIGQHPQPYLKPALDENRAKIIDLIRGEIANVGR